MTDLKTESEDSKKKAELEDSQDAELKEKGQDSTEKAESDDEVDVKLSLGTTQKLKTQDGQINVEIEKIKNGDMGQEEFNKLPEYVRKGIAEKEPSLFDDGQPAKQPAKQPPIDAEKIKKEATADVMDELRYNELVKNLPDKLPQSQNDLLNSEFELLQGQGFSKPDALERAILISGVSQAQELADAKQKGIRISNGALPPLGALRKDNTVKADQALDDEYESMRKEMDAHGSNFTRKSFDRGKEEGLY